MDEGSKVFKGMEGAGLNIEKGFYAVAHGWMVRGVFLDELINLFI